MRRKLRDSTFFICSITVTISLYVFGTRLLPVSILPVELNMYIEQECQPFLLNSSYTISTNNVSWKSLENEIKRVQPGGYFTPKDCISLWKVAVIVPYRNRENHLRVFLRHIHPFLQQQRIEYGIFVIEMPPHVAFNRGLLMNVGVNESRLLNYNCFIFHDVDLLPENIKNIYKCNKHPKHMASAIDTRNYTMTYKRYFGGVNAFTNEQFTRVNGFSNVYFGWGREDDDLYHRVLNANLTVQRVSLDIGRYKNLTHPHATLGKDNDKFYKTKQQRYQSDGLNNLKYTKISHELRPLYTWILIGLNNQTGQVRQEDR